MEAEDEFGEEDGVDYDCDWGEGSKYIRKNFFDNFETVYKPS